MKFIKKQNWKTSRKINLASSILALPYLIVNKAYVSAIIFTSSFINTLEAIYKLEKKCVRNMIFFEHKRVDGRALDEIRPLSCEVDLLPR